MRRVMVFGLLLLILPPAAVPQGKPLSLAEIRRKPNSNAEYADFLRAAPFVGTTGDERRMVLNFAGTDVGRPFVKTGAPAPCRGPGDDCMSGIILVRPIEWFVFPRGRAVGDAWVCLVFDSGPEYRCYVAQMGISNTMPERFNVLVLDNTRFVSQAPTGYLDDHDLLIERARAVLRQSSIAPLRALASPMRLVRPKTVSEVRGRAEVFGPWFSFGLTSGKWEQVEPSIGRTLWFWPTKAGLETTRQGPNRVFWWSFVPAPDTTERVTRNFWLCMVYVRVPSSSSRPPLDVNPQPESPRIEPPTDGDSFECLMTLVHVALVDGTWYRTFSLEDGSRFVTFEPAYPTSDSAVADIRRIDEADSAAAAGDSILAVESKQRPARRAFEGTYRSMIDELHGLVGSIVVCCDPRTDPKNLCRLQQEELLRAILDLGLASTQTQWRYGVARVANLAMAIPEVRSSQAVQRLVDKLRALEYPGP